MKRDDKKMKIFRKGEVGKVLERANPCPST